VTPRPAPGRQAVNWWLFQLLDGSIDLTFDQWADREAARRAHYKHYTVPRLSDPDQAMVVRPMFPI
jgi:hypothetical protein